MSVAVFISLSILFVGALYFYTMLRAKPNNPTNAQDDGEPQIVGNERQLRLRNRHRRDGAPDNNNDEDGDEPLNEAQQELNMIKE